MLEDEDLGEETKAALAAEAARRAFIDGSPHKKAVGASGAGASGVGAGGDGRRGATGKRNASAIVVSDDDDDDDEEERGGSKRGGGDESSDESNAVGGVSGSGGEADDDDDDAAGTAGADAEGGSSAPLILNPDESEASRADTVSVHPSLARRLKPHQREGVAFLFSNVAVSCASLRAGCNGLGALLSHSMGLGKTLTTISLIDSLLTSSAIEKAAKHGKVTPFRTALIVAPVTVLDNWVDEVTKWREDAVYDVYRVSEEHTPKKRLATLDNWQADGGIALIGYEAFLNLTTRGSADNQARAQALLQSPGPDLIVLDEGHRIKTITGKQNEALSRVRTRRRLILTGTPLQNNLLEYHAMLSWIRPAILGA